MTTPNPGITLKTLDLNDELYPEMWHDMLKHRTETQSEQGREEAL